jgi:hypothetical protein
MSSVVQQLLKLMLQALVCLAFFCWRSFCGSRCTRYDFHRVHMHSAAEAKPAAAAADALLDKIARLVMSWPGSCSVCRIAGACTAAAAQPQQRQLQLLYQGWTVLTYPWSRRFAPVCCAVVVQCCSRVMAALALAALLQDDCMRLYVLFCRKIAYGCSWFENSGIDFLLCVMQHLDVLFCMLTAAAAAGLRIAVFIVCDVASAQVK